MQQGVTRFNNPHSSTRIVPRLNPQHQFCEFIAFRQISEPADTTVLFSYNISRSKTTRALHLLIILSLIQKNNLHVKQEKKHACITSEVYDSAIYTNGIICL